MTTLSEIHQKMKDLQQKRTSLIKKMENLKDQSIKGKIDSIEYIRKFDSFKETLGKIQDEMKKLEQLQENHALIKKIIKFTNDKYIKDEEVLDFLTKDLSISVFSTSGSIEDVLTQVPSPILPQLLELLQEFAKTMDKKELKRRKEEREKPLKSQEKQMEEETPQEEELDFEETLTPETMAPKTTTTEPPDLSSKDSLLEKLKEIEDIEPYILDRVKHRKPPSPDGRLPAKDVSKLSRLPTRFQLKNEFLGFKEIIISSQENPNLIHMQMMDVLEDLGYGIVEHVYPLPKIIEVEGNKGFIYNFLGFIDASIECEREPKLKGKTSILVREEGIATFSFQAGSNLIINAKNTIIFAGSVRNMNEDELMSDLDVLEEKIKQKFLNSKSKSEVDNSN
ncbi:MAG: hypothetical protein ACTSRW_01725 [Candidatus Helarchaeota archaeon]